MNLKVRQWVKVQKVCWESMGVLSKYEAKIKAQSS